METSASRIIFLLCPLVQCLSHHPPKQECDQILLENKWYDKKNILSKLDSPHNLVFHKPSENLLFVHSISNSYSTIDFQIAHYSFQKQELYSVRDVTGGCAITIDEDKDVIYLGGDDGIFTYNIQKKKASFYKQSAVNIWALTFRKNLFYISYPEQKLYVELHGHFSSIKDFENIEIDNFLVTENNDIYAANKTGVYKFDHQSKQCVRIIIATVRQITEDNKGDVYFTTSKGIFRTVNNVRRRKISNATYVCGITFTENNSMIISDDKKIMSLVPAAHICAVKATNVNLEDRTQIKPTRTYVGDNNKIILPYPGSSKSTFQHVLPLGRQQKSRR